MPLPRKEGYTSDKLKDGKLLGIELPISPLLQFSFVYKAAWKQKKQTNV
jgi:hypothetical protein